LPPLAGAVLWTAGTLTSFIAMALAVRELSGELGTLVILFYRSLVALLVIGALIGHRGLALVRTRRLGLHVLRNVTHYGGQFGWFTGIALIPLAEVVALEFTTPIWTLLLAGLFLGEAMTRWRGLAVALGFVGVIVILRPGIALVHVASLAVLASAFFYASANVMTKSLVTTESPLVILFYMTAVQAPLALAGAAFDWAWPTPHAWPAIIVVGVTGLTAHYCLSRALALADATVVVPLDFVRLPLIAVIGALLYDEAIDVFVFLGAGLVLTGNMINLRQASRAER